MEAEAMKSVNEVFCEKLKQNGLGVYKLTQKFGNTALYAKRNSTGNIFKTFEVMIEKLVVGEHLEPVMVSEDGDLIAVNHAVQLEEVINKVLEKIKK